MSPCLRGEQRVRKCMAVEIEAKMAVESFEPVRAKLREAGAAAAGSHFEVNHSLFHANV